MHASDVEVIVQPALHAPARDQFSPDGKRIVFASDQFGSPELWVCDSDGSNISRLTYFNGPHVADPRWAPDGRQIAFDSTAEGSRDIYVVSAEGGAPRRLTTESSTDSRASWSSDGRRIYFGSNRSGDWQVWKMPAEGGQAAQVTKHGGREASASPDGKLLYYSKGYDSPGIWRMPVAGGEETRVLDRARFGKWVMVEQGIYFINPKAAPPVDVTKRERRETRESLGGWFVFASLGFGIPPGIATVQQEWRNAPAVLMNAGMPALAESSSPHPTIAFFGFATGRMTQIAALEKEPAWSGTGLTVSPDGRWILYVQMDQVVSDVMLVENFR